MHSARIYKAGTWQPRRNRMTEGFRRCCKTWNLEHCSMPFLIQTKKILSNRNSKRRCLFKNWDEKGINIIIQVIWRSPSLASGGKSSTDRIWVKSYRIHGSIINLWNYKRTLYVVPEPDIETNTIYTRKKI